MTDERDYKIDGRSISGNITRNERNNTPQKTPQEFLDAVDSILSFPEVEALRWTQYTPYFNDGDELVFSIGDIEAALTDPPEDEEDEYGGDSVFYGVWTLKYRHARGENTNCSDELIEALKAWNEDEFETVCRENFGDHALVTATPEGFNVEWFDHD